MHIIDMTTEQLAIMQKWCMHTSLQFEIRANKEYRQVIFSGRKAAFEALPEPPIGVKIYFRERARYWRQVGYNIQTYLKNKETQYAS